MQSSFLRLWELVTQQVPTGDGSAPLQGNGAESKAMGVIKAGMNLRQKQECGNFWDDFIQVMNNTEGVCELLDVRPEQVSGWTARIRDLKEKADRSGDQEEKSEMIPTGEPDDSGDGNPSP